MFEEVFLSTYESIHYCLLDLHGQRAFSSGKIAGKVLRNKSDKALAKKQVVPIYSCFFFPPLCYELDSIVCSEMGRVGFVGIVDDFGDGKFLCAET
jgi:hypothetical protein